MALRKATFEEDDGIPRDGVIDGMPPEMGEPPRNNQPPNGDAGWNPPEHPWEYDQARVKIAEFVLNPTRERMREFTNIPDGLVPDMSLADVMVEAIESYNDPNFNAARSTVYYLDQRLRGRKGWMAQLATLLAGDQNQQEDINPMSGPQI